MQYAVLWLHMDAIWSGLPSSWTISSGFQQNYKVKMGKVLGEPQDFGWIYRKSKKEQCTDISVEENSFFLAVLTISSPHSSPFLSHPLVYLFLRIPRICYIVTRIYINTYRALSFHLFVDIFISLIYIHTLFIFVCSQVWWWLQTRSLTPHPW